MASGCLFSSAPNTNEHAVAKVVQFFTFPAGLWILRSVSSIRNNSCGDISVKALIVNKAYGQFVPEIEKQLLSDEEMSENIIKYLLD